MLLIHKLYIKLIKNFSLIKIKYLFIIFLLSPFLVFIVLIKPIVLIRFGNLGCERIGRFFGAELYLLTYKFKKKSLDINVYSLISLIFPCDLKCLQTVSPIVLNTPFSTNALLTNGYPGDRLVAS